MLPKWRQCEHALDRAASVKAYKDTTMNIKEAQTAKIKLESAIAELLNQFSADTGTIVSRVDIGPVMRLTAHPIYTVQVEVRL